MTHEPHYCRRVLARPAALLAAPLALALALALAACGSGSAGTSATEDGPAATGSATTTATPTPAPTSSPDDTSRPSATGGPPTSPGGGGGAAFLEVVRSGGLAGVRDVVRVAADGSATLLTRDGRRRACRPPSAAVRRLRQMDLTALGPRPSGPPVNDAFVFSVRSPNGAAVAGQQDKTGSRAELVDAAAGVVGACLAGHPTTGGGKL